jgi:DNA-binding IclR family transcriptional regulator
MRSTKRAQQSLQTQPNVAAKRSNGHGGTAPDGKKLVIGQGSRKRLAPEAAPDNKTAGVISSLDKMLSILNLFTPKQPVWSTADIIKTLGTSRSTAYRYIRGLHAVGLLGAIRNGFYVLGPRIVELDLQIRECDPLYRAGEGILERLTKETGHSATLCMLFSSSVLCIREHRAPLSPKALFHRGQRRSLFRGAASKVILPYLPHHQLRNIYARYSQTIAEVRLGRTWEEFRDALAQIRNDGYARTYGEFNPGVIGIAAPVFNGERLIIGSVGIAYQKKLASKVDVPAIAAALKRASDDITERIARTTSGMAMPPRAVG